jgi:hypothetical protein
MNSTGDRLLVNGHASGFIYTIRTGIFGEYDVESLSYNSKLIF